MTRALSPRDLTQRTERRRVDRSAVLDSKVRAERGQYFTPAAAAALIASFPTLPRQGVLRVLDPGAGVGSLTAALVARVAREAPDLKLDITTFEIDPEIAHDLSETLKECAVTHSLTFEQRTEDFLAWASSTLSDRMARCPTPWDLIIMNPPYRKISSRGEERSALSACGIETSNLYTAFMALALRLLSNSGQMVAITPRSFANGTYFRKFRHDLLERVALRRIHVFDRRDRVFQDSEVLQENVILHASARTRGDLRDDARDGAPADVTVSVSGGFEDEPVCHTVPREQVVVPGDPQQFIHIATKVADLQLAALMARLPATLPALSVQVSTGRVVDFRTRENLRAEPGDGTVPLLYPVNLTAGGVTWPAARSRKPQALAFNEGTRLLLLPSGAYCLVKRFTSKEEARRVAASLLSPRDLPGHAVAVENHINVFHQAHHGLDADLAAGLTAYLNSGLVDRYVRLFSGHTQINAGDLRSLRYPSAAQLRSLASLVGPADAPDVIDNALTHVVPELELSWRSDAVDGSDNAAGAKGARGSGDPQSPGNAAQAAEDADRARVAVDMRRKAG